ncbi:NfeD family protein [Desulfatitalea alkaliphila]|uniref:Nodulation protein NfeD n=1 Tax=Desulfatitalea alkaliphila TaxID=2929485 RepID=A0AA41URQ8_9BACT|nr:nodulation protein NfeD [Desulfatitalea alkaliphila]MCJ8502558.1 nodulation protein NfeD [Desulfatitalea alkaliphila]
MRWIALCITALMLLMLPTLGGAVEEADRGQIMTVTVADPIGPGVAEFIEDAIETASTHQAASLVILLDTPGGSVEAMRKIVQAIYGSLVPVVVYVSPSGARAASAGVMITMAADIAAMAPGTNIGAAHPVGAGGQGLDETMAEKVVSDLVAFTKGIAERRNRNAEWAEKAVRESVSVTADEALELNVIDLVATDLDDLIAQLQGREVSDKGVVLELEGLQVVEIEPNLRTRILKIISDPNIAYILFMIGLAGLYFELSNPGAIFPGVVGAIALILAFFAFQTLPVNIAGILLILLSAVLFILEIKVTSYGMLSVAGVISMLLGSMMLFKGAGPEFQVAWRVMIPTVTAISGFFIMAVTLVVRAHVRRPYTGSEGLVGEVGLVKQVNGAEGKVQVHGELWRARFDGPVQLGDKVRVTAVEGLVLTARPADEAGGRNR